MQSKATTVAEYLNSLPEDRRTALEAVRAVILKHKDKTIEEGMQYGAIGYYIPHKVFPPGYHCDPKQPLPFAGLASQKNHLGLYLMCLYVDAPEVSENALGWFREAWTKAGKKLDMGASCVRFKKIEDVPLDVVAALFKKVTAKKYVAAYEAVYAAQIAKAAGKKSAPKTSTAVKKPAAKKPPGKPKPRAK
jgi:hypothetical protein